MVMFGKWELHREEEAAPLHRVLRVRQADGGDEALLWLPTPALVPGDAARARFVESALQARALTTGSGQLRRVIDAGQEGEQCWVAVVATAGETLAERLAKGRPATDAVVAYVALGLAEGLTAAHIAKLPHGYLRACDVIMAGELPRIGGVGLWRTLERQPAVAAFAKSAHLLAPEVRAGEPPSVAADIYAMAVILAQLALGMEAESGAEAAVLRERLRHQRPRLDAALAAAFAPSPQERPSAAAIAASLGDLVPRRGVRALTAREVTPVAGQRALSASDETPDDRPFDDPADAALTIPSAGPQPWSGPIMTLRGGQRTPPAGTLMPPPVYPRSSGEVPSLAAPLASTEPPPAGRRWLVLYGMVATLLAGAVAWGAWTVVHRLRGQARGPAAVEPAGVRHVVVPAAPSPPPTPAPAPDPVVALIAPAGCPSDMVPTGLDSCIDIHEAPGEGSRPALGIRMEQARAACAEAGKRLCSGEEWELACRGPKRASYPWGNGVRIDLCNLQGTRVLPAGSLAGCVSASGAHDMSGNAAEWVEGGLTKGGSALDGDDGRCSHRRRIPPNGSLADVGYRCCAPIGR